MGDITVLDWILGFIILLMIAHGYMKGLIGELFSLAALVLAIWAAVLLYPAGAAFIRERVMENVRVVPELLGFLVIFGVIMFSVRMIGHILVGVVTGANL